MYKIIDEETINESSIGDILQVDKISFPPKAGVTTGDYINVYAQDGTHYALFLDLTGADANPTGANFVAADYSSSADISSATDAASVAAIAEIALNALTDFTSKITTDDTAADGTMLITQVVEGISNSPVPNNEDDSGSGSISNTLITEGFEQPDIYSGSQDIRYMYGYSAQVIWSSTTSSGTLKVQESNDGNNWFDISGKTQAILNNSGNSIIHCPDRMSKYTRVVFTYTSGIIDTLKVKFIAKG